MDNAFVDAYLSEVSKRITACAPNAPLKVAYHFDLIAKLASNSQELSPELSRKVQSVLESSLALLNQSLTSLPDETTKAEMLTSIKKNFPNVAQYV